MKTQTLKAGAFLKKLSSLLIFLLTFAIMLTGCKKSADESSGEVPSSAETIFSTDTVNFLNADGEANYNIIRSDSANSTVVQLATDIFRGLRAAHDVNFKNITDAEVDDGSYEILIGDTNRPESKAAKEYIINNLGGRYNDYIIATMGNKIVIYGITDDSLALAVQYFIDQYASKATIEEGILYTVKTEGDFVDITINGVNVVKYSFVKPRFNTSYLTQLETEKMVSSLCTKTGYKISVLNDTEAEETDYEIIIGNCERSGVEKISDYDTYKITVTDKKVYINGGSPYATAMGVSEFGKMVESNSLKTVEASYNETLANYDKATTYHPTWVEDFDGDNLDLTKWVLMDTIEAGKNGKQSVRSTDPNDVFVKDGCFNIWCRQDDENYYGGQIRTTGIMTYKYGYLEESAIIPHGRGFWSALWASKKGPDAVADGQLLRAEIDVNECFGDANVVASNMHRWTTSLGEAAGYKKTSLDGGYSGQKKYYHPDAGSNFSDTFHTYGFLWTPEIAAFTCDGEIYFSYKINEKEEDLLAFHHDLYLILSVACGLKSDGWSVTTDPEQWANTNKLIVDYVHIYQLQDGVHELNNLLK